MRLKVLDVGEMFGNPVAAFLDGDIELISNNIPVDEQLKLADLILFGGGADIHPQLYSHVNVASQVGSGPSARDIYEENIFVRNTKFHKKPMVGVCRGAQLVCALSGGSLIQDVTGHAIGRKHHIKDKNGKLFWVNSYHHQMMWPFNIADKGVYDILAETPTPLSKGHYAFDVMQTDSRFIGLHEPEVVFFRNNNALGIQCHPEWFDHYTRDTTGKFLNGLVQKQLNKEL